MSSHPTERGIFVTGSVDKTARLWDLRWADAAQNISVPAVRIQQSVSALSPRKPGCTQTLWGHSADVNSVSFHPSGNMFASCSEDKTVGAALAFDAEQLAAQFCRFTLISFSLRTSSAYGIASIVVDWQVRLWDIRADQELAQYKPPSPNSR